MVLLQPGVRHFALGSQDDWGQGSMCRDFVWKFSISPGKALLTELILCQPRLDHRVSVYQHRKPHIGAFATWIVFEELDCGSLKAIHPPYGPRGIAHLVRRV